MSYVQKFIFPEVKIPGSGIYSVTVSSLLKQELKTIDFSITKDYIILCDKKNYIVSVIGHEIDALLKFLHDFELLISILILKVPENIINQIQII